MSFFIGLLTVVLVLNCVLLILLVLVQLPKKDAGAGLAFGGGATDALFGAGSGNVLTKVTKWAIGVLFSLLIILGVLQSHFYHRDSTSFKESYEQKQGKMNSSPLGNPAAPAPATAPATTPSGSNALSLPLNSTPSPTPGTVPESAPAK